MSRRRQANITIPLPVLPRGLADNAQLGDYAVIGPLARGGTAGVYLGEDRATGERVALKVLDPFYADQHEMVQRLLAERTVSELVQHPGLVDVRRATYSTTGVPYLVMEYLDGENLGSMMDRGQLELDALIAIAAQIASALTALHSAGVVHCDIKPDNVFVLYETAAGGWPRIKVIDYGVARRVGVPQAVEGMIAGTPAFMAPEQWRGAPTLKSDVYSLGCMLYELTTGQPLFSGTLPQLMLAHCERMPDRPSARGVSLPPALERLIIRSLAKDPAMRPTMVEMQLELCELMQVPHEEEIHHLLHATG